MVYRKNSEKTLENELTTAYVNKFMNILDDSASICEARRKLKRYQQKENQEYTKMVRKDEKEELKAKLILGGLLLGSFAVGLGGYAVYVNW